MEKNTDRPMSRKSKLSLSTKKRKSALSLASPSSSLPVGDAVDIESTQSSLPRTLGSSNNNNTANTQSDTTFSQQAPIVMESNNESVEANPVNNQHTEEPQSLAPVTKSQQLSQSSSRDASTQVDELSQDSTQHSIHSLEPSAQQQHPSTPWEDIDDTTSQNEIPNTPRNSSSKPNSLQQFKSASGAIDTDNADKISSVEQSRFPDMHSIKNESSQRSTKSDKSSKPSYDTTPFPSKENMDIYFEDNAKGDETQYVVCSLGKINSEQRSAPIDKDAPLYTESVSSSPSTTNTMKKPLQEVSQSSQNMVESQPSSEVTKSMSSPSSSSASGRVSFRELFKSTDDEKYMPKKRKIPASMRDKLSLSKTRKRQNP
ncbi:hypothetical protein BDB00DRAFT_257146 [Zychaea mexicana]|uniref:uncharacterized protein n=1 Tax=Zychaea mexicana TaxID=64656 RepID=UPI0022FED3D1|nr:uncharacterized protein BDB00DRAFT_257146 [Zychaea mexicana]KAI9495207.1 hypothetical protein BDB00DRAFT_257146 [Zychaea mexicana]